MDRFSEAKMLELAEAYREQELLWKVNHVKYKDKTARNNAYQQMVDQMKIPGLNVAIIIKKIKNLRSSYYHELKRIDKGAKTGYRPKLAWFPVVDSFLKPYHFVRTGLKYSETTPQESQSDNSNNSGEYDDSSNPFFLLNGSENEDSKFDVLSDANENIGTSQYFVEVEQNQPSRPDFVDTDATPSCSKKRKHEELNDAIDKLNQLTQQIITQNQNNDEYDIFGKYVAYSLKHLSRENAIRAKKEIQEIVSRMQLQDFHDKYPSSKR